MTKEEIVEAAKQLPLAERKLLLRDLVLRMQEEIEVANPADKRAKLEWLDEIARLHGFSSVAEDPNQPGEVDQFAKSSRMFLMSNPA